MTAPHIRPWPVPSRSCHAALLAAALSAAAAQSAPLSAQTMPTATAAAESVTVVAGSEYRASRLQRELLGREYRELWTAPVRVPVLDLARTAGGLTPTRRGGGNQTVALRLKGADGREYQFRSLDKVQTRTLPPGFQRTLVSRIVQDQAAALHPASALVAAPLMQAAGVLHVEPALYVMPDDPRLGAFRGEFTGRLGTLELRPDEGEGGADNFAHARAIVSSESFLKQLEELATHQVDAPDYLTSRLMDLYFGDWDRYEDQYRWARFDSGGVHRWRPIPRDHDYAFTDSEGTLIALMRTRLPKASAFRGEYPKDLYWLIAGAQNIDPRLLAPLERSAWDSVALALQARLTDAVIDDAVRRMPPEYHALNGEQLARTLRERRDALPAVATRYYALLAEAPEVHATDESEQAEVERLRDGSVVVRLWAPSRGAAPYFERRFRPAETHEVRLYMHGGDDQVRVYGTAQRGVLVRVIGGGGRDLLQDSGRVRAPGVHTAFYDTGEHTRFVTNAGTRVDRRTYQEPPWDPGDPDDPPRTSGGSGPKLVPYLNWSPNLGPVIGGGLAWTRFGFRQQPYASKGRLIGMWAPFSGGVAADFTGDFRPVDSRASLLLHARASHLDRFNFFGFGNDTRREGPNSRFRAPLDVVTVDPLYRWLLGHGATLGVGPLFRYTDPERRAGSPLVRENPYGSHGFGQIGAQAVAALDRRDSEFFPRHGVLLVAGASGYPDAWDAVEAFGQAHLGAATYLSANGPLQPTLALRGDVHRVWGKFPVFDAAFLGGAHTLRGYSTERYAGDAALSASAELRARIAPVNLWLVRGDLGALALTDVGRVYLDGESPGGWHSSVGGGLWFAFQGMRQIRAVSVTYAQGEHGSINLFLGMPF